MGISSLWMFDVPHRVLISDSHAAGSAEGCEDGSRYGCDDLHDPLDGFLFRHSMIGLRVKQCLGESGGDNEAPP